jgi:ribose 5-phosphate isomerase B
MSDSEKRIAMACDHAGLALKRILAEKLAAEGYEVVDVGTHTPESGDCGRGILVCGSGIGMSIAANKTPGVRAVVCTEPVSAKMSRLHNDTNVLCVGERLVGAGMAWEIASVWLATAYEGGRHAKRVSMLESD